MNDLAHSIGSRRRGGFTLTEVLIVISVIAVLLGILLVALGGAWKQGEMTASMNHMRSIGQWMEIYSNENSDFVLPSQFDYTDSLYPAAIKVRRTIGLWGDVHEGTWTDILWTVYEIGALPDLASGGGINYELDSPDKAFYELAGKDYENPLRSTLPNSIDTPNSMPDDAPLPFNTSTPGAAEKGEPGYFAANNFFNSASSSPTFNGWYTRGQIRFPDQSMYLVDSFAGEVIEDECFHFQTEVPTGFLAGSQATGIVDFRYSGGETCLMLFLDGHVDPQSRWRTLDDLEGSTIGGNFVPGRSVRVRDLTSRSLQSPACVQP